LKRTLQALPSKVVLFVDACHSRPAVISNFALAVTKH
jgi:hypothetical protein